ncbi:hypothetical protein [Streptomyces sp. NPDC058964]|uniref:hypothetical protein n=1 Tax=Streptomyces sp. NPDC058964 TaxID=3346681 RepID=UPI0036A63693
MIEGCAVASVLGMLEEREAAAGVRVEGLREEASRLAEVLEAAEIELDRRVIAREELVKPWPCPSPRPWRDGLPVTVLTADYQRILSMLEERRSAGKGPAKAKEIAVGLGLGTTPAKAEGVRSKARRLAERGWLLQETSGMFSAGQRPVAAPDAGPSS